MACIFLFGKCTIDQKIMKISTEFKVSSSKTAKNFILISIDIIDIDIMDIILNELEI